MANAYSILHNYDRPLYAPNYQLIASAMQYKQGKLDANRARLQTVADQIGFADVAKGEDKEYVENRLQSAVDIANKYAALDLSSSSLTNQLIGKVAEVVDDNVKNAVLSTKVYRSEQAEWAKKQEEEPDLYSEDNYQYAMRGANAWLNDGKYGTKYNGGGGFIAYDNYGKRVQDNIIEIAKQLKATYVVQENGQGMFVDNVTKEAVDRGRLEAAIDGVIGDTGRSQMMRESWNRSRFVDDETLQSEYNSIFAPQVDEADRYIVNLKAMASRETDPTKKKELLANLESWENRKNIISNQSYESVGKENAYLTLHANNFKKNYLDAYSYGPLTIKREVDQNHVKTVEFEEKVREFELNYALKEKEFALKEKEFDLKEKKAMFDMGIDPTTGQPISGLTPINTPEELGVFGAGEGLYSDMNIAEKFNQQVANSVADLSKQLGGGLGEADLLAISDQVTEADVAKGGKKVVKRADGEEITLNFDDENVRKSFLNFKRNVAQASPELNQVYDNIGSLKNQVLNGYLNALKSGTDDFSNLPVFTKSIKEVNGQFVVSSDSKGNHEFKRIVEKVSANGGGTTGYNKLSKAEKHSLDMFIYGQMMIDEKVPESSKKLIFNKMRRQLVETVGWNGLWGFPKEYSDWQQAGFKVGGSWVIGSNAGKGFVQNSRGSAGSLGSGEMISDILGNSFVQGVQTLEMTADAALKSSELLPQVKSYSVSSKDARQKGLKSAIGQSSNKDDVQITFEVDENGKATGAMYYSYYQFNKDTQKKELIVDKSNKLSKETAESLGFTANDIKPDFDATYGSSAPTFSLGGNDDGYGNAKSRAESQYGVLAMDDSDNITNILNIAAQSGDMDLYSKVNNEIRAFHGMLPSGNEVPTLSQMSGLGTETGSNNFNVKLAPRDGQYNLDLEREGKVVYSMPVGSGFTTDELSRFMYDESHYFKHALYNQYLNSLIGSSTAQSAIKKSEEEVKRIISSNY